MNRKRLVFIILTAVALIGLVVFALSRRGAAPVASPSPSPTVEATATPGPDETYAPQALKQKQDELAANPLLGALPKNTAFWSLSYDGVEGDKYVVSAVVFFTSEQDPGAQLAAQKPYIEGYVNQTGQAPGTYAIRYQTRLVNEEF